jgi:SAM-dependent methyltransferase
VTSGVGRCFDAMAEDYEVLEPWYQHLYAALHEILRAELAPPRAVGRPRALDAGCGTGFQARILAELGYVTHGVDLSAGLLRRARRAAPGAVLAQGDLVALPYPDDAFDAIACCGSTLSFVARPAAALTELGRVLRPGGRLLLECEARFSLDLGWALLSAVAGDPLGYGATPGEAWRRIVHPRREGVWQSYPGYPPLRLATRRELDAWLAAAGLVPVRTWGLHAATNLLPSTTLHRARLPAALAAVDRALRKVDRALAPTPVGRALANSLVVLAEKRGTLRPWS